MALNPHSETPEKGAPEDYAQHHPEEHPEDWGWHGAWGRTARVAGWIIAIILVIMITATHYNHSGAAWLIGFAVGLIAILIWDVLRRKNAWRQ